jgi:membrane protein
MLLGNIEKAFNDIWGVRRGRSFIHRFQVYWPLVTLGPILVGFSLALTAALETSEAVKSMVVLTPMFTLVFKALPVFLTWVFLTLLYMFLPNTHVPFRSAVVGGIIAGTLWEVAKQLYILYAGFALSVPSVYGSLVGLPLFILWIYVSWVVVLLGATLTFAIQNARTYEPETQAEKRKSQRDREFLAARLLVSVSDSFDRGKGAVPAQALLDEVIVAPRFARRVLSELVEAGLLVETVMVDTEDAAFVPGRPLHTISVADIVRAMRGKRDAKSEVVITDDDVLDQRVCSALLRAEKAVDDALGSTTLAQLLADARSVKE